MRAVSFPIPILIYSHNFAIASTCEFAKLAIIKLCEDGVMAVLNQIRKFVDGRGISRYRFWQDTGLGRDTAYRLYNDPTYIPTGTVLEKICGTYKVQPGEILLWREDDQLQATVAEYEKSEEPKPKEELDVGSYSQERKRTHSLLSVVLKVPESA